MYIKTFKQLRSTDAGIAGGKGASLGEMTHAGISVPPGFVLLAASFDRFIEETEINREIDAILHHVDHRKMHTVDGASERIQALVLGARMPEDLKILLTEEARKLDCRYVAVRSSATAEDSASAAWAGQLESFLNTTEAALPENVQRCWASLFTPRAIFYRHHKGLHDHKISVAVVVQKMVESEVSGVAFSVHPVTQDHNQVIIEASYGLGEAIVSGKVIPDSYVVEKASRHIIDRQVSTQERGLFRAAGGGNEWQHIDPNRASQQVLKDEEIERLAELVIRIEKHYGFPVDVEWAYERGIFYIVQSRPITTLQGGTTKALPQKKIDKDSFERLFYIEHGEELALLCDIFGGFYSTLGVLQIVHKEDWTSYIPKKSIEQTQREGIEIFCNENNYKSYVREFKKYIEDSRDYFNKITKKKEVTRDEVSKFFELARRHFYYYSKTEFFYTDRAFERCPTAFPFRNNAKEFEDLKSIGRSYLNSIIFSGGYVPQLVGILSSQFGTTPAALRSLKVSELLDLFDGLVVDQSLIESRKEALVVQREENGLSFLEGDAAKGIIELFDQGEIKPSAVLQGIIASKGVVVGTVMSVPPDYVHDFSIIKHIESVMKQGDILVAETTSPELMPLCRKAGAIITNQGGQLSHAAIVSREMGIPCIIAVANATKLLHDGDMVEVDANRGMVRIVKR